MSDSTKWQDDHDYLQAAYHSACIKAGDHPDDATLAALVTSMEVDLLGHALAGIRDGACDPRETADLALQAVRVGRGIVEGDAARDAAAGKGDLDEIIAYVLGPGWTRRAYEARMDGGVTMWTRPQHQRLRLTVDRDCYTLAASSTPGVWVEATAPLTGGEPDAADFEVDLTRLAGEVGWDVVDDD